MWQGFTIALREGIEAFLIVALTLVLPHPHRPPVAREGRVRWARGVGRNLRRRRISLLEGRQPAALGGGPRARRRGPRRQPARLHEARVLAPEVRHRGPHRDRRRRFDARPRVLGSLPLRSAHDHARGDGDGAPRRHGLLSAEVLLGAHRPRSAGSSRRRRSASCGRGWAAESDLKTILNISAVFLAIFVVQLVLYGVHELSEAQLFPASQAIHDATEVLGPDGRIGQLLAYALAVVPTACCSGSGGNAARPPPSAPRSPASTRRRRPAGREHRLDDRGRNARGPQRPGSPKSSSSSGRFLSGSSGAGPRRPIRSS